MNKSTATSPDYVGFVWNSVYPKRTLWLLIIFHWHHNFWGFLIFFSFSDTFFFHRFPLISTGFPWRIPIEISSQPQRSTFRTRPDTEYWEMALNATKADFPFDTWRANLSGTVPKFLPFFKEPLDFFGVHIQLVAFVFWTCSWDFRTLKHVSSWLD